MKVVKAWWIGLLVLTSARLLPATAPVVHFASQEEGRSVVVRKDEFIRRLSAFDRAARLKSGEPVSEAQFLEFVGAQVLAWDDSGRTRVEAALAELQPQWARFKLPWPKRVTFIRTTGREEGRAAYTRGTSIILPAGMLERSPQGLADLLAHEFFHVLSRANPRLRKSLYAAIGFKACPEVIFPPELAGRRITNPDAPVFDQAIELKHAGRPVRVVPVLHANVETYPAGDTREFFKFLHFGFWPIGVQRAGALPLVLEPDQVTGFDEQVGKNTGYIIHPEEILADNFKLILRQSTNIPSPEVTRRIEAILRR